MQISYHWRTLAAVATSCNRAAPVVLLQSLLIRRESFTQSRYLPPTCGRAYHSTEVAMHPTETYEAAIVALNSLQSNAETLAAVRKLRAEGKIDASQNLRETDACLTALEITPELLNDLNVVHISGTKGKGSTCAYTEAILRRRGIKTGFYSSPHLVHARERIRLNGRPISERLFAIHFWHVWNRLKSTENLVMPTYFKFLTVLAYYVFVRERVQAAVIEVGIGGAYDCTNVISCPTVCGVSRLDLDHQPLLGYTLPEIAWHKAGIFKPGVPAVTVRQSSAAALKVMRDTAHRRQTELYICQPLQCARQTSEKDIQSVYQAENQSLAIQLCNLWLTRTQHRPLHDYPSTVSQSHLWVTEDNGDTFSMPLLPELPPTPEIVSALDSCHWPGRFEILQRAGCTFFIDGAHTPVSMEACADWFVAASRRRSHENKTDSSVCRVLVFYCTMGRSANSLMSVLQSRCDQFDVCIFCPALANIAIDMRSDQADFRTDQTKDLQTCAENRSVWLKLLAKQRMSDACGRTSPSGSMDLPPAASEPSSISDSDSAGLSSSWDDDVESEFPGSSHPDQPNRTTPSGPPQTDQPNRTTQTLIRPSVADALADIQLLADGRPVHALVTGSLHLVGALLANIDPELTGV